MLGSRTLKSAMLALAGAMLLGNTSSAEIEALLAEGRDAEAFALVEKGANTGSIEMLTNLAWLYDEGRGTAQDRARAGELYREAAASGHAFAQWRLGTLIDTGEVPGDPVEAVSLFKQAVYRGNTNAMTSLAVMYAAGRGVEQDFDQTRMYYEMAARQGNAHAIQGLGVLYANGEGVEQDMVEALAYWLIATQMGNETAAGFLNSYSEGISRAEQEILVERANELIVALGFQGTLAMDPVG